MNKKFHITIVDNEAGTTELDMDTDCIVGAVHKEDGEQSGTVHLGYSACNGMIVARTAFGAIKVSKQITYKPGVNAVLAAMLVLEASKKEGDENGVDAERENEGVTIPFPASRKDPQS